MAQSESYRPSATTATTACLLAGDRVGRNRGGKALLTLEATDRLLPPVSAAATHTPVACLPRDGRLLAYGLDELRLQPGGGRGVMPMDVDAHAPLLPAATLIDSLRVLGSGRGNKPREELLKLAALAESLDKRARRGRMVARFQKVLKLA